MLFVPRCDQPFGDLYKNINELTFKVISLHLITLPLYPHEKTKWISIWYREPFLWKRIQFIRHLSFWNVSSRFTSGESLGWKIGKIAKVEKGKTFVFHLTCQKTCYQMHMTTFKTKMSCRKTFPFDISFLSRQEGNLCPQILLHYRFIGEILPYLIHFT